MVNPTKMDDFWGTPILGNHQLLFFLNHTGWNIFRNYPGKIEQQVMLDNIIPRKDK